MLLVGSSAKVLRAAQFLVEFMSTARDSAMALLGEMDFGQSIASGYSARRTGLKDAAGSEDGRYQKGEGKDGGKGQENVGKGKDKGGKGKGKGKRKSPVKPDNVQGGTHESSDLKPKDYVWDVEGFNWVRCCSCRLWLVEWLMTQKAGYCKKCRRAIECLERLMWNAWMWDRYDAIRKGNRKAWLTIVMRFQQECPESSHGKRRDTSSFNVVHVLEEVAAKTGERKEIKVKWMWEINVNGSMYVAKYASIAMSKRKKGVIIFVSSVAAEEANRG